MYRRGTGFIIRLQSLGSGSVTLTHTFSTVDLTQVAGANLTLTTAGSTTSVVDTKLSNVNTYLGRTIEFLSNANATSLPNVGLRRVITSYTVASQTIGFSALPANAQVGDRYKILSPVPAGCKSVGFVGMSWNGPTASSQFSEPTLTTISNQDGLRWQEQTYVGTATPSYGSTVKPHPVEFPVGDGGSITVTVEDLDGTWSQVTDFYLHFVGL